MDDLALLVFGLVGLWVGTELVVRGAMPLAEHYRLTRTAIGVSVLAVGTDLPELAVAIGASFHSLSGTDSSGMVLGSALGSAIGQFGLALGIAGLVGYLFLSKQALLRHGGFLIGGILLLFATAIDGVIDRTEGATLTIVFLFYFLTLFKDRGAGIDELTDRPQQPAWKSWMLLAIGFVLLLGNADVTVGAATALAERMNLHQSTVAVVIVGIGSSLPELSISIWAIIRKMPGLSLGNIIGSNMLDTLLVPGLAALISPLRVGQETLWFDLPFLALLTLLVLTFLIFFKRGLQRREALILVFAYVGYVVARTSADFAGV